MRKTPDKREGEAKDSSCWQSSLAEKISQLDKVDSCLSQHLLELAVSWAR